MDSPFIMTERHLFWVLSYECLCEANIIPEISSINTNRIKIESHLSLIINGHCQCVQIEFYIEHIPRMPTICIQAITPKLCHCSIKVDFVISRYYFIIHLELNFHVLSCFCFFPGKCFQSKGYLLYWLISVHEMNLMYKNVRHTETDR